MNDTVNEGFLSWISSLVAGHVIDQFSVFMVAGLIGIVSHFVKKKYIDKEITSSFWSYMLVEYPDRTLITFCSLLAACLTYLATGVVASTTWPALIGMAFTTGFSLNSSFNKGK